MALALIFMMLLLAAIVFSELDVSYVAFPRVSAAVRQTLGIRVPPELSAGFEAIRTSKGASVILVADHNDNQRLIAKTTLERYGYQVVLVENQRQAVSLFRLAPHRIRLVILDRSGEQSSVDKAIHQLKGIRPDVRILVTSAGEQPCTSSRTVSCITKPFSAVPLAAAVRKALAPA
jgi:CheY-like chemotaxis protein